jgi:transposase InsO family protein
MKGKRFTAEQIIRILQEADAGLSVADVCLKHNCESFNLIFRTTCLDRWLFCSMTEARVVIINWLEEYNTIRPHGSLGGMNPEFFTAIEQTTHLLNTRRCAERYR